MDALTTRSPLVLAAILLAVALSACIGPAGDNTPTADDPPAQCTRGAVSTEQCAPWTAADSCEVVVHAEYVAIADCGGDVRDEAAQLAACANATGIDRDATAACEAELSTWTCSPVGGWHAALSEAAQTCIAEVQ